MRDIFDFDDLNFYFDPNANIDCCPGDVRSTRSMAESLSKVLVQEKLASSDPRVLPGLPVLDPSRSTSPYKSDTRWINTGGESYGAHKVGRSRSAAEHGEMSFGVQKAREAGVATQITEEHIPIEMSRFRHLRISSFARSDTSTLLVLGMSEHHSIAETTQNPPIP